MMPPTSSDGGVAHLLEVFRRHHRADAVVREELDQHAAVLRKGQDVRARHSAAAGADRVAQVERGVAADVARSQHVLGVLHREFAEQLRRPSR